MTIQEIAKAVNATEDQVKAAIEGMGDVNPSMLQEIGDRIHGGGLAVAASAITSTSTASKAPQTKGGSVATQKKGGAVSKKAQKIEATQVIAQSKKSELDTLSLTKQNRNIAEARTFFDNQDMLETELAEAIAEKALGMEASIAGKVMAMIEEAGDTCSVPFGQIARDAMEGPMAEFRQWVADREAA